MVVAEIDEVISSMSGYKKLIMYGAGANGTDLKSKVKMQKLIFFCTKARPDIFGNDIYFSAYKKGPYSEEIESLLVEMENAGLMSLPDCSPTALGTEVYNHMIPKEPVKSIVDEYKSLITILSEDELLTFIYVTYPEYQKNLEEWGRLQKSRIRYAASMLKKQAISFSKAEIIADLDAELFIEYLVKNRIRWRYV